MTVETPPSSDLLLRFGRFIGWARQAIVARLERGGDREGLGPLGLVVWSYFGRTLLRLAALQARVQAGTLRPARPRAATASPAAARPADVPARPALPRGAVLLLRFHAGHLAPALAALIDDPEMRALLAATPRAGRLLRPLWRRVTPERLPESLRLPKRLGPARPRRTMRQAEAEPASARPKRPRKGASRWRPHWAPHGPMPPPTRREPVPSG